MIRSRWVDDVLELTIDRPGKRNALDRSMYEDLQRQVEYAGKDEKCAAIILTGAGGIFTAGADIADFREKRGDEDSPAVRFVRTLVQADVPLIAAVEGFAIGIGCTLLQHMDFVYSTAETRYRMPFVQLGLCPEVASTVLMERIVGPRRAREWLLQCRVFDGQEAFEAGFVTALAQAGHTLEMAHSTARDLAALPRTSLIRGKVLMRDAQKDDVLRALDVEVRAFADLLNSDETQEIFKAFLEGSR
ncbi:enoyl-CoA hydratase/isomerase family protein [Alcaligenes sp. 13f]|uniref:enoyl-CoA hydratase/isomerase family protein n=1 Tax=Alcaligenes sp. 13f TaxID=2841924 RepID=UPI001CF69D7E|nr:enoyl-CoA hydratase-related protein [Alcaligenes sp. 13f]MCB4321521.1 enoyl-CoA hydratase/isomerase family protein [Alcaligenes sp. 13f]